VQVGYRLKFRHILSNLIWSNTRYWWSTVKTVKYWEISVRNRIIKMFFEPSWYLVIPDDTWQYQQYLTKTCYILQIYWTKLVLNDTWQYLHNTSRYLAYNWQYLVIPYEIILKSLWKKNLYDVSFCSQLGQFQSILYNTWQYLAILGDTWQYLAILGNTWQYLTILLQNFPILNNTYQ
jgi:hypothetical protein